MRGTTAALLLLAAGTASAGQFCAVTAMGVQCDYHSLSACQQFIRGMDGQCVVNPQALQTTAPPPQPVYRPSAPPSAQPGRVSGGLTFPEAFERGAEAGRRARMEREEHQARMALLQAQTEAARAQGSQGESSRAGSSASTWADLIPRAVEMYRGHVLYDCGGKITQVPEVGCTVAGFTGPKR